MISSPARKSGLRPNNRGYQSMLASRSATATPAYRRVIALAFRLSLQHVVPFPKKTAEGRRTHRSRPLPSVPSVNPPPWMSPGTLAN
jgi:hypothetical protein